MKIAAYCRVSQEDLNNENQVKIINDYCKRLDWQITEWYKEEQSSRKTRPIKNGLMQKLRNGEYDILIFVRLDRFARSSVELITDIEELVNRNIRVISIQNGFDWSKNDYNSTNMLMLRIFSAFAEFERAMIRERTMEGLAQAKTQGRTGGRPRKCAHCQAKRLETGEKSAKCELHNKPKPKTGGVFPSA